MEGLELIIGAKPDGWQWPVGHNLLLGMWLLILASWRTGDKNPVSNHPYRQWLATSPWTPNRELPFGPVLLVWQDVFILGSVLLLWTAPTHRLYLLLAFFVPYCAALISSNFCIKAYGSVYASLFIASFLPFVIGNPWLTLLVTLGVYASCHIGFRAKMRDFPWNDCSLEKSLFVSKEYIANDAWPLVNRGRLRDTKPKIPWKHVIGISFLVAWLASEATYFLMLAPNIQQKHSEPSLIAGLLGLFTFFAAIIRYSVYANSRLPPLGLLGRIATGKLIIPGYDVILLAPLVILGIGCALPIVAFMVFGLSFPIGVFICVFTVLVMALGMGPSLPSWILTGEYRMVIGKPNSLKNEWVQTQ